MKSLAHRVIYHSLGQLRRCSWASWELKVEEFYEEANGKPHEQIMS